MVVIKKLGYLEFSILDISKIQKNDFDKNK